LLSFLFKNDPRLEACLHENAAHVLLGAHGEHVAKIQAAIYIAAGLKIAPRELAFASYGPSTAKAVLKYKTDRQIINHSYQQKPDDIVGKMTIAALDAEVRRTEGSPIAMHGRPPTLHGTVGRGCANFPIDVARVGGMLWVAGYGPAGDVCPSVTGAPEWSIRGPLPPEEVHRSMDRFVDDTGLPRYYHHTVGRESALLYTLYRCCC
jgi:hypothetical protein